MYRQVDLTRGFTIHIVRYRTAVRFVNVRSYGVSFQSTYQRYIVSHHLRPHNQHPYTCSITTIRDKFSYQSTRI